MQVKSLRRTSPLLPATCVTLALCLAGCDPAPAARPARPEISQPEVARPLPGSAPDVDPYPMPSVPIPGTGAVVEHVGPDVELQPDSLVRCPRRSDSPRDRSLELVAANTHSGADIIAVANDPSRSVAGWRLASALPAHLEPELMSIQTLEKSGHQIILRIVLASRNVIVVAECGDELDRPLEQAAHDVRVIATVDASGSDAVWRGGELRARRMDWTGDGNPEVLLDYATRQRGTSSVLLAPGEGGLWEPVMELASSNLEAVLDLDRDGVADAAEQLDATRWRVRTFAGGEVRTEVVEAPSVSPPAVDIESLPGLPVDVYARSLWPDNLFVWRWPRQGGPRETADDAAPLLWWQTLGYSGDRRADRSVDGSMHVRHVADLAELQASLAGAAAVIQPPADVLGSARGDGYLVVESTAGADAPAAVAIVETYTDENRVPDREERGFAGLRMSSDGDRLAWADGVGLWVMDVPLGRPRLLYRWNASAPDFEGSPGGLHYPAQWSPSGDFLLVDVRYYSSSASAIWSTETRVATVLAGSGSGGSLSTEVAWLGATGLLVLAHSGPKGSNPDEPAAPVLSIVDPAAPEETTAVLRAWPMAWRGALDISVLGVGVGPHGTLVFGLQSSIPIDPLTNGIFAIRQDGSGLRRIAPLPYREPEANDFRHTGSPVCRLAFASDSSTFLCHNNAGSGAARYYVGRSDTGEVWDAAPFFRPTEGGAASEVAFVP